jgi:hypothetical protein
LFRDPASVAASWLLGMPSRCYPMDSRVNRIMLESEAPVRLGSYAPALLVWIGSHVFFSKLPNYKAEFKVSSRTEFVVD